MLAGLIVLSLLPLLVSNAAGYLRSTRIIDGLVERYLDGIAELQALHVSGKLEQHILALSEMASNETIRADVVNLIAANGVDQNVSATLERELSEHPGFEALYVFTSSGEIIASAPLPPEDLAVWIGPPLRVPERRIEVVRDSELPHAPRLRLALPLLLGTDIAAQVFVGGYMEVLGRSQFLQIPEHTAGSVESFIVDESGTPVFISHPHGFVDYGARLATPLVDLPPGSSDMYLDRQGVEVVGTLVAVPNHDWRLVTEVPVSDALRELRQLRRLSIGFASVLAALVVILALGIAGKIVAPVRNLVSATRRLAAGDLGTRVRIRERNEIGELGTAFNEMAEELAHSSARVKEMHDREIERAGQLATVGELASGVAHEIKNPIAGIAGGLDLVMRHRRDHAKLRPIVDEMSRQIARVELAVKDLLAFARPAPPTFELADLNKTVERALTLVRPTADSAGVEMDARIESLSEFFLDEEMILQALVNLMVNAIQATEKGGRVTVTTCAFDDHVETTIIDTGKGITPNELSQIFKPFYTTRHQGTGLGLSITRDIIEQHGGAISVESEVGTGTTFTFRLPLTRRDPSEVG